MELFVCHAAETVAGPAAGSRATRTKVSGVAKTWILTGSLDNFRATRERGFTVIGAKEGRRRMAEQIEPGDRIVFYITGLQAFGAIVRVTGEMYEDREKIWPGKPGNPDPYPWRFETEPELVLDEADFVPAVELAGELEHVRKWPAEHWQLAFQGQLRIVTDADAGRIERRLRQAAPAAA
jgi:predicted RNA-binding protein